MHPQDALRKNLNGYLFLIIVFTIQSPASQCIGVNLLSVYSLLFWDAFLSLKAQINDYNCKTNDYNLTSAKYSILEVEIFSQRSIAMMKSENGVWLDNLVNDYNSGYMF